MSDRGDAARVRATELGDLVDGLDALAHEQANLAFVIRAHGAALRSAVDEDRPGLSDTARSEADALDRIADRLGQLTTGCRQLAEDVQLDSDVARAVPTDEASRLLTDLVRWQRERLRAERVAQQVAATIHRADEIEVVAPLIVEQIGQGLGASRIVLRIAAADGSYPVVGIWTDPTVSIPPLPDPATVTDIVPLLTETMRSAASTVFGDLASDARLGADGEAARLLGARSLLAVWIPGDDAPRGLLIMHDVEPHRWSSEDLAIAEYLAREVGAALRRMDARDRERSLIDELRAVDDERTALISSISHELRTPLTTIVGYLELIEESDAPLSAKQCEMVQIARRSGERMRRLVEDLLTLAELEGGARPPELAACSVPDLVSSVFDALAPLALEREVRLSCEPSHSVDTARWDAAQVELLLLNVVGNAVKFTEPGGTVDVEVDRVADDVVFVVRDTGIGIPQEDQARLFSRFFRASNAVERPEPGTGLGLAIARGIVESHGGWLTLSSAEGEGTTVRIALPLDAPDPA